MGHLGSCGYKRGGVGGGESEMTGGSGLGVWRCPFLRQGALGEGQVGERMATVWNCPVNYQNWAGANLKFTDMRTVGD